ncbi:MAG: PAS domain-containing protein [[Clostridium] scindens]
MPNWTVRLGFRALDILGKSIPGGMIGGYLEPGFPLYYVNDFLLSYLGYTYDEFNRAINGMVINCIHPDDRKAVDEQVAKAFSEGSAYEIQYRMKKKNGDYIWVNDIGKKGLSEDGHKVCISVIRDISLEVESREGLERQARRVQPPLRVCSLRHRPV